MLTRITPKQQRKLIRKLYSRARDYDIEYGGVKEDIVHWIRLCDAVEARKILELGVGTGRVAIPLARKGYSVVGLDITGAMIERAWDKINKENCERGQKQRLQISLLPEDFSAFNITEKNFDVIFIALNTFYHLLPNQRATCFESVIGHLKQTGIFVIDVFNIHEKLLRYEFGLEGQDFKRIKTISNRVEGNLLYERLDRDIYDYKARILHCDREVHKRYLQSGYRLKPYTKKFDLYILTPNEMETLLSGYFKVDYALSNISEHSVNHVWVCRRKDS
jgi:SAM-dependent methyltransferase